MNDAAEGAAALSTAALIIKFKDREEVITKAEVLQALKREYGKSRSLQQTKKDALKQALNALSFKKTKEKLLLERLKLRAAEDKPVSELELEREYQQLLRHFGGSAAFKRYFEKTNGKVLDQAARLTLKKRLKRKAQLEQLTQEWLKEWLQKAVKEKKAAGEKAPLSEAALRAHYKKHQSTFLSAPESKKPFFTRLWVDKPPSGRGTEDLKSSLGERELMEHFFEALQHSKTQPSGLSSLADPTPLSNAAFKQLVLAVLERHPPLKQQLKMESHWCFQESELPAEVEQLLNGLAVGEYSKLVETGEAISLFFREAFRKEEGFIFLRAVVEKSYLSLKRREILAVRQKKLLEDAHWEDCFPYSALRKIVDK